MTATCGRTIWASGVISPAWFMPISNTPNARRAACAPASAARPSGCCRTSRRRASAPASDRHRRSISLVPVLPTLPVTATMRALAARARGPADGFQRRAADRRRAAARRRRAARDSRCETRAAAAPALNASATNSWPSRSSFSATNTSPGASAARVDREAGDGRSAARRRPRLAAAATSSSHCHRRLSHGSVSPSARRAPPRGRRRAAPWRRRSGRSRGPCRRPAAHRRGRAARAPARIASARSPISRAPGRAGQDLGADRLGLLAARIVVGDDDVIGERGGDPAHDRPLALVAVAAAAEHAHEPARRERAQRLERGRQRVGLVRVVDDDEAAAHLAHDLEPALRRPSSCSSAGSTRSAGSPAAMARPAASSALDAW